MKRSFGRAAGVVALCFAVILTGCSTNWIDEAEKIVAALIPAAANLVTLVELLNGKSLSAVDMATIQNAGTQAEADLQLARSLIAAYRKADAAEKPGIVNQMQSAILAAQGNLQGILPALHIKDTATQEKVTAVVGIVLAEVQSLAAVVGQGLGDRGQGQVELAASPRVAVNGRARVPLSADQFVKAYNTTLTAKTGNAELDRVTAGLEVQLHGKVVRVAGVGLVR